MIPDPLWPSLVAVAAVWAFVSLLASVHIVLRKRDERAAVSWLGLAWLVPVLGAALYALFGVNRIKRRAIALHARSRAPSRREVRSDVKAVAELDKADGHLLPLVCVADAVSGRSLLPGNAVTQLVGGERAYPEMIEAIDSAQRSVGLCSYIFDNDETGRAFCDALARAARRGVEVRVLVDAMGAGFRLRPIHRELRNRQVTRARFLPTITPELFPFMNLRNHRKILVVDGEVGFTGGMNISALHVAPPGGQPCVQDVHFRLEGPIVAHLSQSLAEDWCFTTGEELEGEAWFPELFERGGALARGVSDGPDEDFGTLRWILLGALSCARSSVRIVTPYFLPDAALLTALNLAALRKVDIDIVVPQETDHRIIDRAVTGRLWEVIEHGCRVHRTPPPFDHTKLVIVDETWVLIGSTNWDPRSLRLNFELNVELFDRELAAGLEALVREKIAAARLVTRESLDARPFSTKLGDGVARLFSPYL